MITLTLLLVILFASVSTPGWLYGKRWQRMFMWDYLLPLVPVVFWFALAMAGQWEKARCRYESVLKADPSSKLACEGLACLNSLGNRVPDKPAHTLVPDETAQTPPVPDEIAQALPVSEDALGR